jgi:hypothetical protein
MALHSEATWQAYRKSSHGAAWRVRWFLGGRYFSADIKYRREAPYHSRRLFHECSQ